MAERPAATEPRSSGEPGEPGCHQGQQPDRHRGGGHSLWWMALCCLLPLLLVGGYFFKPAKSLAPALLLLLCPLMHLLMMRGMGNDDRK